MRTNLLLLLSATFLAACGGPSEDDVRGLIQNYAGEGWEITSIEIGGQDAEASEMGVEAYALTVELRATDDLLEILRRTQDVIYVEKVVEKGASVTVDDFVVVMGDELDLFDGLDLPNGVAASTLDEAELVFDLPPCESGGLMGDVLGFFGERSRCTPQPEPVRPSAPAPMPMDTMMADTLVY